MPPTFMGSTTIHVATDATPSVRLAHTGDGTAHVTIDDGCWHGLAFETPEAAMQWAHRVRVAAEDLIVADDHARGLADDEYAGHYGPVGFYEDAS